MLNILRCEHRAIWPGCSSQRELRQTVSRKGLNLPSSPFSLQPSFLILTPCFFSPALRHPLQNGIKRPPSPQPQPLALAHGAVSTSPPKSPLELMSRAPPITITKPRGFSLTLLLNSTPSPIHRIGIQPLLPATAAAQHHQKNKPPHLSFRSRPPLLPKVASSISSTSPPARSPPHALSPLSPRVKSNRSKPPTSRRSANSKRSLTDVKLRSQVSAMRFARAKTAVRL